MFNSIFSLLISFSLVVPAFAEGYIPDQTPTRSAPRAHVVPLGPESIDKKAARKLADQERKRVIAEQKAIKKQAADEKKRALAEQKAIQKEAQKRAAQEKKKLLAEKKAAQKLAAQEKKKLLAEKKAAQKLAAEEKKKALAEKKAAQKLAVQEKKKQQDEAKKPLPKVDTSGPSVFAVLQQQGPVCPYIPYVNLEKIKDIRARGNGEIVFSPEDFKSKLQGYAEFLPQIRALDDAYDRLRSTNGAYKVYEDEIRTQGIRDEDLTAPNGDDLESMDEHKDPLVEYVNQTRREEFTPYNFMVQDAGDDCRFLPIFHKGDKLYFYNHETRTSQVMEPTQEFEDTIWLTKYANSREGDYQVETSQRYKITPEMERLMGGKIDQARIRYGKNMLGTTTAYLYTTSTEDRYQEEVFYDIGTYQHMLFACGLDRNNNPLTPASQEYAAHAQFKAEMDSNPLNPWKGINKQDLLEYHLTRLFQQNPVVKEKAKQAVNFINSPWKYYQESFQCKANGIPLSQKQKYLPGEDQMLSYFFAQELMFLWEATMGSEAIINMTELEGVAAELGAAKARKIKALASPSGPYAPKKIIAAGTQKKYGVGPSKFSFVDVWTELKGLLKSIVGGQKDFVTFSGHGRVISFDDDLVNAQQHEDKATAKQLGFEIWEQLYDKGLKNLFYKRAGSEKDIIKF